jgi:hypothetical protein
MSALRRIPPQKAKLYRGVKLNLTKDYEGWHGHLVVRHLCHHRVGCVGRCHLSWDDGDLTQFTITVMARNIAPYSAIPKENELIILPGTIFKVVAVMQSLGGECFVWVACTSFVGGV